MLRAFLFVFLLATFALKSFAIEPILDQQAMVYFNVSFDAGYKNKSVHDFGLRFDRGVIQPGETMTIDQLMPKTPVFNLGINKYGIKTFDINGINITENHEVFHAAEAEEEEEAETKDNANKKTKSIGKYIDKAPTGVLIGIVILTVALADSTSSN